MAKLTRNEAGDHLKSKFRFGGAKSLSKLASVGGGPKFHKLGPHPKSPVIYDEEELDRWAIEKLGPLRESTSNYLDASHKRSPGRPRRKGRKAAEASS